MKNSKELYTIKLSKDEAQSLESLIIERLMSTQKKDKDFFADLYNLLDELAPIVGIKE